MFQINRSKYFFLIIGIAYFLISIFQFGESAYISEFFSVAISLSALFISLSDILINAAKYINIKNKFVSKLYEIYIKYNNKKVLINNGNSYTDYEVFFKEYIKTNTKPKESSLFFNNIMQFLSVGSFIIGISIFIVFPYISNKTFIDLLKQLSPGITTLAFSIICFSIYISEKLEQLKKDYYQFIQINSPIIPVME